MRTGETNEEILRMISTRAYVTEVIQLLFQISCFASGFKFAFLLLFLFHSGETSCFFSFV